MKENATDALGTAPVGKLLFRMAMPAVAAQIINLLYNLVDRMYIGHIQPIETVGKLALTGVGVCLPIIMVISAFAALVSVGGASRASISLGKRDQAGAEAIMGSCFALMVVVSAVLTLVVQLFAKDLLLLFGASENTVGYALRYIRIYSLGTIFVQLTLGMNAFITAQGFSRTSMVTTLVGAVCNIILDPIFIFALDMGVSGAALATILSQALSMTCILVFLTGKKATIRLRRSQIRLRWKVVLPCVALGLAPFVMQATESLIAVCFNSSLYRYGGDLAVGAMTILTSVMQFSMMPLHGLTQGAQPITSYNYGARNAQRVRQTFRLLLTCCVTYSAVFWCLVQMFPTVFVQIFNSEPELVAFTARALRIYMAVTCIFGAQIACQQTFIALGNAKSALFLALLRKVILLIPLIYILPMLMADKTTAVFLAEPVADLLAVITTVTMFTRQFRKTMAELEA